MSRGGRAPRRRRCRATPRARRTAGDRPSQIPARAGAPRAGRRATASSRTGPSRTRRRPRSGSPARPERQGQDDEEAQDAEQEDGEARPEEAARAEPLDPPGVDPRSGRPGQRRRHVRQAGQERRLVTPALDDEGDVRVGAEEGERQHPAQQDRGRQTGRRPDASRAGSAARTPARRSPGPARSGRAAAVTGRTGPTRSARLRRRGRPPAAAGGDPLRPWPPSRRPSPRSAARERPPGSPAGSGSPR